MFEEPPKLTCLRVAEGKIESVDRTCDLSVHDTPDLDLDHVSS
jgi:hypothetical protein